MDDHRDPYRDHIDAIRDWMEFLEVLDAWENTTSSYWDVESAPDFYSQSGRYDWWATVLADWIIDKSNVPTEPLFAITRMIKAKDPLGQWTAFTATADEIERCRQQWQPYQRILIGQAERALARDYDPADRERDKWLYEQWQHRVKTWDAILQEFKLCRAANGWRVLSGINGIRSAAKRFATINEMPFRKGKAGRPKQVK